MSQMIPAGADDSARTVIKSCVALIAAGRLCIGVLILVVAGCGDLRGVPRNSRLPYGANLETNHARGVQQDTWSVIVGGWSQILVPMDHDRFGSAQPHVHSLAVIKPFVVGEVYGFDELGNRVFVGYFFFDTRRQRDPVAQNLTHTQLMQHLSANGIAQMPVLVEADKYRDFED